jgi:hypothetical protein
MTESSKYKKFILFQFHTYYPSGGLGDIQESFDSPDEAKECATRSHYDNAYVVDRDTWEAVWEQG